MTRNPQAETTSTGRYGGTAGKGRGRGSAGEGAKEEVAQNGGATGHGGPAKMNLDGGRSIIWIT